MRAIPVFFSILIIGALVCGCTSPSSVSTPASPAQQQAAQASQMVVQTAPPVSNGVVKDVEIIQRAFNPAILRITPGTTVVWTNKDAANHRVVHLPQLPSEKELFHSEALSKGESFSYTFSTPGEFYYGDPQMGGGRSAKVIVE